MNLFSEFKITSSRVAFTGDKIKIDRILNREIVVIDFKIEKSKFEKASGKCLHLQIEYNNNKHVVFTGSIGLIGQIEQVPIDKFPFKTTIVKENDRFEFT